jgi:integrase
VQYHDQGCRQYERQPALNCYRRGQFERAGAAAQLPPITPRGMRHTMATLLLAAGVHLKIVQERLGHSSIKMTLDRCSHVSMSTQADVAKVRDALLGAGSRPNRGHETG